MIWRYFDFAKFASVLDKRALFFARLDLLNDPFEGSVPTPSIEARDAFYGRMQQEQNLPESIIQDLMRLTPSYLRQFRAFLFVNCWCMSEHESSALWDIYGKGDRAVVIQSTFARLRDSLTGVGQPIHIGMVRYLDYAIDVGPADDPIRLAFCKRKGFEHEGELRSLLLHIPTNRDGTVDSTQAKPGHFVPIDVLTLIEKAYVAPEAADWFLDLVRSVASKLGFPDLTILPSKLDLPPRF